MKDSISLGKNRQGEYIKMPITSPPRIGILGISGSGKSVMTQNIILCMAKAMQNKVQFVGIDPKLSSLSPVSERFSRPLATDPNMFYPLMSEVLEELDYRKTVTKERGIQALDPDRDGDEFPMIMFVAEELISIVNNPALTRSEQDAIQSWFSSYLTQCRALNMGAIIVSHTFSSTDALRVVARSQLEQRIAMKATQQLMQQFNDGEQEKAPAWTILKPGEFFFSDGNPNLWVRGMCAYPGAKAVRSYASEFSGDVRDFHSDQPQVDLFGDDDGGW